jgi:hypothetical protein
MAPTFGILHAFHANTMTKDIQAPTNYDVVCDIRLGKHHPGNKLHNDAICSNIPKYEHLCSIRTNNLVRLVHLCFSIVSHCRKKSCRFLRQASSQGTETWEDIGDANAIWYTYQCFERKVRGGNASNKELCNTHEDIVSEILSTLHYGKDLLPFQSNTNSLSNDNKFSITHPPSTGGNQHDVAIVETPNDIAVINTAATDDILSYTHMKNNVGKQLEHIPSKSIVKQIYGQKNMTVEEFQAKKKIRDKNNKMLCQSRDPSSRPKCTGLHFSDDQMKTIKSIFFTDNGSFNTNTLKDIDYSSSLHGLIQFTNGNKAGAKDKRWQVPIKNHDKQNRQGSFVSSFVRTRQKMEYLLIKAGHFDPTVERIAELTMLIGGTEDQSIHHDVARYLTSYHHATYEDLGWEEKRKEYNEAMRGPHAPCSMLFAMSTDRTMNLGVQSTELNISQDNNSCTVREGDPAETFPILRSNEWLTEIEINGAVAFTGDFLHAGVAATNTAGNEGADVNAVIAKLTNIKGPRTESAIQRYSVLYRDTHNLDTISRLHLATEPLYTGMVVPKDTIGYTGAQANRPDGQLPKRKKKKNNIRSKLILATH